MSFSEKARAYFKRRLTLKNLAISGVRLAILGQITFPVFMSTTLSCKYPGFGKQIEIKDDHIENLIELGDELTTRDYLNLASGTIHKYSEEEDVCRHQSSATYQRFHDLIEKTGRSDLEDNVRLAMCGTVVPGEEGHAWIELYERGEWEPFESTFGEFISDAEDVKFYSEITQKIRTQGIKTSDAHFRTFPGTYITYPTLKGILHIYPIAFSSTCTWFVK